ERTGGSGRPEREREETGRTEPSLLREQAADRPEGLHRRVADRPHAAVEPPRPGEDAALQIDRVGARPLVQAATLVPGRAPVTPSPGPSQSTSPCSSTIRVASITVPTSEPFRPPATPNET